MEAPKNANPNGAPAVQSCCASAGKSGPLSSRNVLIGAAALGVGGSLYFGWNWLVAAGFASIIISLLPCLVMCGLGLCMSRMGKKETQAPAAAPLPPKETQIDSSGSGASASAESTPAAIAANPAEPQTAKRAALSAPAR